jgi:hypothetical protein
MRGPRQLAESTVIAALGLAAGGVASTAAAAPDVRGEWAISGKAIVVGAAPQHPAEAPPPAEGTKPRLREFSGTMRVEGQEGGERFWGVIESPVAPEPFVAMFTGEGGRFVRVDVDGFTEGEFGEDGTIRYCYRHVTAGLRVVSCGTATRR